ncbi:MAG: carboxypeptidase regulatory-like domain-containing protein [Planctomycetes bacterium]|nr:carboxypeptidase regulatory-like domain-containing protein [Planctomycetota bacterium]
MLPIFLLAVLVLAGPAPSRGVQGRVLSGRVLAQDAKPVAHAEVLLLAPATGNDEARRRLAQVRSDAEGRFELHASDAGAAQLFVRAENEGVRTLALEAGSGTRALGDLALVGPAWLSGRASFPDGHPAADVELWAVPEEVAMLPNALILCVEEAQKHELAGEGLFTTRVRTDGDGGFRLAGLREGRYMLRCPRPEVVLEPRIGYYHATTENIALSVQSARLRVRALAPDGRELLGAKVRLVELNETGTGRYQPGQMWKEEVGGALACASFDVQPESAYGVRVSFEGYATHEDLVMLAQNEFEQLHEYRLEPARPPGRVRLSVKPVEGFAPGAIAVDLVSPLYGSPDPEAEPLALDAQGWLPPLPPGSYLFALRFPEHAGTLNWYLPTQTRKALALESKQELECTIELELGARVELELAGTQPAEAQIEAEGLEGQGKFALHFTNEPSQPARARELLPPGRYRIGAQAYGRGSASAECALAGGAFTKLTLALPGR